MVRHKPVILYGYDCIIIFIRETRYLFVLLILFAIVVLGLLVWFIAPLRLTFRRDGDCVQAQIDKLLLWSFPVRHKIYHTIEDVEAIANRLYLIDRGQGMQLMPHVGYKSVTEADDLVQGIRRWIAVHHTEPLILQPVDGIRRALLLSLVMVAVILTLNITTGYIWPDGANSAQHSKPVAVPDNTAIATVHDENILPPGGQYKDLAAARAAGMPHDVITLEGLDVTMLHQGLHGMWYIVGKFSDYGIDDLPAFAEEVRAAWRTQGWETSRMLGDADTPYFFIRRHKGGREGKVMMDTVKDTSADSGKLSGQIYYTADIPPTGE